MKSVIQRVKKSNVKVDDKVVGSIDTGLLALVAISEKDTEKEINWMVNKIINLRIFSDSDDKMNLSLLDVAGELLVISNFTLYGSTRKGFRPSFSKSAKPDTAIPLYEKFIQLLKEYPVKVETGVFGAMMDVELVNDGPVTLIIDTDEEK
jgi:D-aminoacyl-tRNA deacylase